MALSAVQADLGKRAEACSVFALHLLLFLVLNRVILFGGDRGLSPNGNALRQLAYVAALGLAVYGRAALPSWRGALPPPTILLAVAWFWLSVSWAIAPAASINKLVLATMVIGTIFLVAGSLPYERIINALRWQTAFTLALCYVIVALLPDIGMQMRSGIGHASEVGGWRGALLDKNACGAFCAITILLFLFAGDRVAMAARVLVIAAALFLLYMSQSKTSLGILAASMTAGVLVLFYNRAYRALLVPAVALLAVGAVLLWPVIIRPFADALHDPVAFTGRGPIWAALLAYSADHPWTGAGYGSFWGIGPASPIFQYTDVEWIQKIFSGHNGYLDMLSQVGVPGLVLIMVAMLVMPVFWLLSSAGISRAKAAFLLSTLIFAMGNNLTESTLFDRDTLLNVVALLGIGMLHGLRRGRDAEEGRAFVTVGSGQSGLARAGE